MKITVSTNELQKFLSFVNHAVSSRGQLPILLNILLEAKKNHLQISGTDLEIGIQVTLAANVSEEGATTVPAKIFSELIASLPNEPITLYLQKTNLFVTSKKTKSTLQTISHDEFPKLYQEKGEQIATLERSVIEKSLGKIVFAASFDANRPALAAVLLKNDTESNGVRFVATDGYRLSLDSLFLSSEKKNVYKGETPLLIPARVIREVLGIKQGKTVDLFVSHTQKQIIFSQEHVMCVGRLIEAEFPSYEKIIPQEATTHAVFDKEELLNAVKLCSIFARETANIIRLAITKEQIVVSANTPSVGENTVMVDAKVTGEENEIAFNARYVLDILSHVEDDEMSFEMTGPLNPGVFKIPGNTTFLHLIMPIRVQG